MTFKALCDRALCIVFPRRCKYCGKVIVPQKTICSSCEKDLPVISSPICHYCGYNKEDCSCKHKKSFYKGIVAPFYYEGVIRTAIDRMKFHSHKFICTTMAEDMAKTVLKEYESISFDVITFVPFSKQDKKTRDFNHSEEIAIRLSKLLSVRCVDTLCQIYEVPTQHSLGSEERKGNVFGIYEVNDSVQVKDKTILLVDDIKTTGSTLNECAKMLNLCGAKEVYCAAFAVTKRRSKE